MVIRSMSDVRDSIQDEIQAVPGIHFNEVVRRLQLAPGQVQYHIRRLIATDEIVKDSLGGRTHYFPQGVPPEDRQAIAVLRRESANAILTLALENGEVRPKHVADRFDLARSTVEYHLERLEATGLIQKGYSPDGTMHVSVPCSDRGEELLSVTDPDMVDRLTDRFDRLVDGLLSNRS